MYPGTIYNWFDNSEINRNESSGVIDNSPLFMVVGSFDKGTEKLQEISGKAFNLMYGSKMYFEKHGQNAIQAQRIIDAGGRLLIKRVCATDATLANLILVANVTISEVQKTDKAGNLIYLDENGEETTTVTSNPVMIKEAKVKWEAKSVTGCKTFDDVLVKAKALLNDENGVYPVFVYTENGRGVSGKSIRLIPDYPTSKSIGKTFYTATVYEGTAITEATAITVDPTVIQAGSAYGLDRNKMVQVFGEVIENSYEAYINKIADALAIEPEAFRNYDVVYGYTNKGASVPGFVIDSEGVDLNSDFGVELKNGSNGAFGDKPVNTEAWVEAIRSVYAGEDTTEIYDVDQHKIAAICDANYPFAIKEAIAEFVNFRKDCMFFRDFGTGLTTFMQIKAEYDSNDTRSRFIANYGTSYEVKDPVTKKNIEVTMMYDFVECLVAHIASNPFNPAAGIANGFVLREAIKGTINYTPVITPSVNQKQAMDDIRVNYAIFEDDNCVVQTCYTSQEKYTELSFINNVLAIQQVARAVRTACPKNRYTLASGSDMSSYAKAVNNVLSNFSGHFASLSFDYTKDKLRAAQKIFYASIYFSFNQWAQTEIFDLFAINSDN